ncbi:hypothetical protein S83_054314, partial [Arachis hypogaea]
MKMYKRSIKNVAGNEGDTGFKWEACKGLYPLHRGSQDSILLGMITECVMVNQRVELEAGEERYDVIVGDL